MFARNAATAASSRWVAGNTPSTTKPSSVLASRSTTPKRANRLASPSSRVDAFSASASVSGVTSIGER